MKSSIYPATRVGVHVSPFIIIILLRFWRREQGDLCVLVHARTRDLRVSALLVWRGERSVRSREGWSGGSVSHDERVDMWTGECVWRPNSSGGCLQSIYTVYMTMTRDCDCGAATARRNERLGGGDGKTELFALYVTEKNPGYCLIENPR